MQAFPRRAGAAAARLLSGTLIVLMSGTPWAVAHHSDAMFDHSKEIKVGGTVKDFQWTNPHVWLQLVTPANQEEGFEAVSPNTMSRNGWKARSLATGDKVTVYANPRRDGASGGFLLEVDKADGTVLHSGPPRHAPGTPAAP